MQHLDYHIKGLEFPLFIPYISRISSLGIVPVTLEVVPAPHLVPPLVPPLVPLLRCPAPLPGGGGTRIPPLVLALGVAPGRGRDPLRDNHSRVEAEDCAGTIFISCSSGCQSEHGFNSYILTILKNA